jgi:hypothetical protein
VRLPACRGHDTRCARRDPTRIRLGATGVTGQYGHYRVVRASRPSALHDTCTGGQAPVAPRRSPMATHMVASGSSSGAGQIVDLPLSPRCLRAVFALSPRQCASAPLRLCVSLSAFFFGRHGGTAATGGVSLMPFNDGRYKKCSAIPIKDGDGRYRAIWPLQGGTGVSPVGAP